MCDNELTITPCRIIPCDIGSGISDPEIETIRSELSSANSWSLNNKLDSDLTIIEAQYNKNIYSGQDCKLSMHLFDDGVCVYCLEDYTERYNDFHDYDPERTLERRFEAHNEFLSHTHQCSGIIRDLTNTLRGIVDNNIQRFTASSEWESGGFSYVFSFYFLDINPKHISKKSCRINWSFSCSPRKQNGGSIEQSRQTPTLRK